MAPKYFQLVQYAIICLVQLSNFVTDARLVEFGENLVTLIRDNPDRNWLINFYTPWCYHCQRLEPTFIDVSEKISHNNDNLMIGRVDCKKFSNVCEHYQTHSYPTIMFISKHNQSTYNGDRTVTSILEFAERLNGPNIRNVAGCDIMRVKQNYPLVILSTISDTNDQLYAIFSNLAAQRKADYWFYNLNGSCSKINLDKDSLYIIKKELNKPVKFESRSNGKDIERDLLEWISQNAFPIYGRIHRFNFESLLASGKPIVLSLLDRYEPAKAFTQPSAKFHNIFARLAIKLVQQNDKDFIYAWTSDLDLMQTLMIGQVLAPNVMILRPDYTFATLIKHSKDLETKKKDQIPTKLSVKSIEEFIKSAEKQELEFQGGSNLLIELWRRIYTVYFSFLKMYKSSPLLVSLLIGFPTIVSSFVIYMTCFGSAQELENQMDPDSDEYEFNDNEDDGDDSEIEEVDEDEIAIIRRQRNRVPNHVKQD